MGQFNNSLQTVLSKQCHYDYGMRCLKAVTVYAGVLRKNATEPVDEMELMSKAIHDVLAPRIVQHDRHYYKTLFHSCFKQDLVQRDQDTSYLDSYFDASNSLINMLSIRHAVAILGIDQNSVDVVFNTDKDKLKPTVHTF